MGSRIKLGELLVEAQIITREQLDEILALQRSDGRRLGALLMDAGLVTETQVTQILSQQLSVPWVSLYHIDFSRQLLNLVPRDLAERYCLVPIFVRRVRGIGEALYVAMDDPSDENAQREASQYSGLPVRAMIAPPSDIRAAIRVYYGAGSESASLSEAVAEEQREHGSEPSRHRERRDVHPPESTDEPAGAEQPPAPESSVADEPAAAPRSEPRPVSEPTSGPDSGPEISAREIRMPAPKRGRGAKMITLTLLDGTQINLPAKGRTKQDLKAPAGEEVLTARDLIAALQAAAHGADAKDVLGENVRWEAMFAALLSVLLRKHLIADWEFIEEYKKL
jgi:type IV pilus assembly protein PilB